MAADKTPDEGSSFASMARPGKGNQQAGSQQHNGTSSQRCRKRLMCSLNGSLQSSGLASVERALDDLFTQYSYRAELIWFDVELVGPH